MALTLLSDKVAATSRPTLSPESLDALLDQYVRPDREGRLANDVDWVGSWDLNAAAAEGWSLKAGKVAGDFNFSADGASYNKADVLANCLAMRDKYASLSSSVLSTGEPLDRMSLPRDWDGNQVP